MNPDQSKALDRLIADGKLQRGDAFVSTPRSPGRTASNPKREIEHIDADGVITFAAPPDGKTQSADDWLAGYTDKGLNTDDFSQAPTIDADKSADWNRKAKTVKPGSFAARRMAGEE